VNFCTSQRHRGPLAASKSAEKPGLFILKSILMLGLSTDYPQIIHRLSTDYPQIIHRLSTDYPHAHGHIRRSVLRPLHAARMPLAVPNTFKSLLLRSWHGQSKGCQIMGQRLTRQQQSGILHAIHCCREWCAVSARVAHGCCAQWHTRSSEARALVHARHRERREGETCRLLDC
jgi:hypothetical protein